MDTSDNIIQLRTAEQHNAPQVGSVKLPPTADNIRSLLVELFDQSKPQLQAYHNYAEKAAALSLEFHTARLAEVFPGVPVEELTVATTLDTRETPRSLDTKLAQLANVPVKRIVFDRANSTFILFV